MKPLGPRFVPFWTFCLGSLLLSLLFAGLAVNDYQARKRTCALALENQGHLQTLVIQRAHYDLQRQTELLAATLASDAGVLARVREIDRALRAGEALGGTTLDGLRQRLSAELSPAWQAMQAHQARLLQVHWGAAGLTLLRMQDPAAYGDALADERPLLHAALRQGRTQSNLDVDRHGVGNRSIVPLRASDDPASPVIGALEVGFGMLPSLVMLGEQLDAGLALVVNRSALSAAARSPVGIELAQLGDWLLDSHSSALILRWAQRGELPDPATNAPARRVEAEGRTFLLKQIPLRGLRAEQDPSRPPLAAALVWSDITGQLDAHALASRLSLLKWGLAWLIAEALLLILALLLYRRIVVQQQHWRSQQRRERSRRRLLERTQKITSLVPGMICQLRIGADGSYAFLYVSEGARELYGIAPEQLVDDARLALGAVHPDDLPRLRQAIARSTQQPGRHTFRYRILHPQAGPIWAEARTTSERQSDGSTLWHGVISDVTELTTTTQALQDSESRFRSMVSNIPGVVYRCRQREQWRMSYMSEGIERLTGYPASDFTGAQGRSYAELIHPDDQAQAREIPEDLLAFERTYRLIDATGRLVWVREKGRVMAVGNQRWADGFIWDVTQQTLAEQALRESQERLAALYRLAPVGIVLSRLDDGRLLEWNPELARLSGYSDEALARLSIGDLQYDEDNDPRARDQPSARGTFGAFETELRCQDGTRLPVLLNGALMVGANGKQLVWSIIQNISERVLAEREAAERERYLRLLIANVIDAIIIINQHGIIETFNHAAEHAFGYRDEEVIGRNLSMLMPEPHRSAHDGYLDDYASRGTPRALEQNRELTALRRNGETFTIELRVSQISHRGERKFIGLVRDITERKRIDRMKSEFVSTVSHELRTPLTSIAGALGLIVGGAVGEPPSSMRAMLDIAHQNALRLRLLIDDLLDMEKLVAGKMPLDLRAQPLAEQLDEALRCNQSYAEQHGVRLQLASVAAVHVTVDAHRLQQVLANFLANAAKFSPAGEVVTLSAERRDDWVRVSVADCGPGIAAEFKPRIFQKFSQADSSDTRQKGGTGLGLAISKELIERMHGRIGFDSQPGNGACFWFELAIVSRPSGAELPSTLPKALI